jgi:hypothetical protein
LKGEIIPIRQRVPDIPAGLAALLDRAVSAAAKDRYADAGEMLAAIEQVRV